MKLSDPITAVKGIGDKSAKALTKLHIETVQDLIRTYPRDYDRLEEISQISDLQEGERAIVRAQVVGYPSTRKVRALSITTMNVSDGTGKLQLTFFNMPYVAKSMPAGSVALFRGKVSFHGKTPVMEQAKMMTQAEYDKLSKSLLPMYPLTFGIHQSLMRKAVEQVLREVTFAEILPEEIIGQFSLMGYQEALAQIHFPDDEPSYRKAHDRLAFQEFLEFILAVRRMKDHEQEQENAFPMIDVADTHRLLEALPYQLTEDQKKVWQQIEADLSGKVRMNRLVQGDVGSGKTILATLALLKTVANGYQGALMAPTEVLALQHFESIRELSRTHHLPLMPILLTGSLTAKEKKQAYELIARGDVNCIIGTHALIQDPVEYHNLALVITDEQHRFGVKQRETFSKKGKTPNVCVMSATPIPRTLAMILYGDLHISAIHQLPAKRLPILNYVVDPSMRERLYRFIEKEAAQGHQSFVICPMIETDEEDDPKLTDVKHYGQNLRKTLPNLTVEILHGQMKPKEKSAIMNRFARGEIDVLVSTTVIEVGINVPNATIMMIENAERFGLAQLHQLRGRVGRGDLQSYCIFVNCAKDDHSKERLNVLKSSNDGFHIAEEDLRLRGPGDLFGVRQSGEMNFHLADIYQDKDLLLMADEAAGMMEKSKMGNLYMETLPEIL
ncbi:MAG: ATP-dependent DNA helicase RecG [Lachnospiraceae bacterium]|nr:ATP-dependent DNA helicase RecG [Lachnospiraceae bacterium]